MSRFCAPVLCDSPVALHPPMDTFGPCKRTFDRAPLLSSGRDPDHWPHTPTLLSLSVVSQFCRICSSHTSGLFTTSNAPRASSSHRTRCWSNPRLPALRLARPSLRRMQVWEAAPLNVKWILDCSCQPSCSCRSCMPLTLVASSGVAFVLASQHQSVLQADCTTTGVRALKAGREIASAPKTQRHARTLPGHGVPSSPVSPSNV